MSYNINKIFGKLPAIAHSLEEVVDYEDNMVILEITEKVENVGEIDPEFFDLVNLIIDSLDGDGSSPLVLLECEFNSLPNKDVVHRVLQDGSIYSSYYQRIGSRNLVKTFVAKNIDDICRNGNILCFSNAIMGFTIDYLYIIAFNEQTLEEIKNISTEHNYVNMGRNNFGIKTFGKNKFDIPFLNLCTPALNSNFSYINCVDSTTKKVVELFRSVNYVLRKHNNRALDNGYFIRVNLDNEDNSNTKDSEGRSLLEILELLDPAYQKMRIIYHGVLAESMKDNRLLLSGKLDQDSDTNAQLQSFLSDEINITHFLRGKFDHVLQDESIFFNKKVIFTYYDQGADFRFFNKKDYEKFFTVCNKNHTIQMATYIPEGEHVAHLYPHRP